mgnify:CR=1 FL=1
MTSETGFDPKLYDRLPAPPRPESEVEDLKRIWTAPGGWARITAVNAARRSAVADAGRSRHS